MRSFGKGLYEVRGKMIIKESPKGWTIENDLNVYATLKDAINRVYNYDGGYYGNWIDKPVKIIGEVILNNEMQIENKYFDEPIIKNR